MLIIDFDQLRRNLLYPGLLWTAAGENEWESRLHIKEH